MRFKTGHFRRRPHVDVKIGRFADRIFANDQTKARHHPVDFGFFRPFVGHENHRVILIVLADAVELMHDGNAVFLELRRRTDTGQHQNLRRTVDARCHRICPPNTVQDSPSRS